MIFLLNKERVLVETVELARLRLVGWLGVPDAAVAARIERAENGSPKPVFDVDMSECKLGGPAVENSIRAVYGRLKVDLQSRLATLGTRWGDA